MGERKTDGTATALRLDARDNVATALEDIVGEAVIGTGAHQMTLTVQERIPMGHKLALRNLDAGAPIIKYGEIIGHAKSAIAAGAHVHVHNLASARATGKT